MSTLTPLSEVEMLLDLWNVGPRALLYRRIRALKSEKCNKTLVWVQVYGFWYIFLFFLIKSATIGFPKRLCSKNSDQLPVLKRLTNILAVGKFDYGVLVQYQNLTRKPELFQAPWARVPLGPDPGTMYPLSLPLAGPGWRWINELLLKNSTIDGYAY